MESAPFYLDFQRGFGPKGAARSLLIADTLMRSLDEMLTKGEAHKVPTDLESVTRFLEKPVAAIDVFRSVLGCAYLLQAGNLSSYQKVGKGEIVLNLASPDKKTRIVAVEFRYNVPLVRRWRHGPRPHHIPQQHLDAALKADRFYYDFAPPSGVGNQQALADVALGLDESRRGLDRAGFSRYDCTVAQVLLQSPPSQTTLFSLSENAFLRLQQSYKSMADAPLGSKPVDMAGSP